jgi:uncharacterized Zn-binding protein involved in type VI secretion
MPAAARMNDMHTCPMANGNVPHVGGPISPSTANTSVFIGGQLAAVKDDKCICVGASDTIMAGSSSVMIAGKPAARKLDATAHGGTIMMGCETVIIGG